MLKVLIVLLLTTSLSNANEIIRICGKHKFTGYTSSVRIANPEIFKIDEYSKYGFKVKVLKEGHSTLSIFVSDKRLDYNITGETNCRRPSSITPNTEINFY